MDAASRRSDPLPPSVLAALRAASSPRKSAPHPQREPEESIAVSPAFLRALVQGHQQQPPWPVGDSSAPMAHPHGSIPQLPPGVVGQPYMYAGASGVMPAYQVHPQQLLALQQLQLAQHAAHPPPPQHAGHPPQPQHTYQLVHPPMDVDPPKDPFVYVQREVREATEPPVMEGIKKRALFVADPLTGGRLRIAQACERCRKRKTKCTGEKPTCKRCVKRGYECEYVLEHRANKTKKAVAEREKAEREAEEAEAAAQKQPKLIDSAAMPICPPLVAARSSSSGYSVASASSLPPPLMTGGLHGQHLRPFAAFSPSPSPGYYGGSLASVPALPTPTIMIDGRPLGPIEMLSLAQAQGSADIPPSLSRTGTQPKHPSPVTSERELLAMSRSSSAMSVQSTELPAGPAASTSCQACLAELADCLACASESHELHSQRQHLQQQHADIQRSRSMPEVIDLRTPRLAPPSPPPQVKQHLIDVLTKVLAQKEAGRAAAAALAPSSDEALAAPTPTPTPLAVPPLLAHGASSSSSGSGSEMGSGMQTPQDYFAYPAYDIPSPSILSPAVHHGSAGVMKTSESMAMAGIGQGMPMAYLPSPGYMPQEPSYPRDGEGGLRFSDYFHSFEASDSESMQSIQEY
ncbi:hypothetical protein BV20DRAFT_1119531 [Pilatotrama ljubarskyi]|nr:hypothetical protein BV20DRAFT_1119531 [Pilatotrama ljubarskyi]